MNEGSGIKESGIMRVSCGDLCLLCPKADKGASFMYLAVSVGLLDSGTLFFFVGAYLWRVRLHALHHGLMLQGEGCLI